MRLAALITQVVQTAEEAARTTMLVVQDERIASMKTTTATTLLNLTTDLSIRGCRRLDMTRRNLSIVIYTSNAQK